MATEASSPDATTYRISVVNRNQQYSCRPDDTLLAGMELKGARCIHVGCRSGGCGMCKIRILAGEFESKRMSRLHVTEAEAQQGFALSCRVLPRSDMVIESDHFRPIQ